MFKRYQYSVDVYIHFLSSLLTNLVPQQYQYLLLRPGRPTVSSSVKATRSGIEVIV